ncbi:MAG TPA: hypothetical protein VK886_12065 [Vicinamibacterales bacterium]|nr:hypothetical protein [Vicinamibacterales bacterium]
MRIRAALVMAFCVAAMAAVPAAAAAQSPADTQALRARIEARYDIVPLTDGIALRPKARGGDVRLIEIADGAISINGSPVTGGELRDRVGRDADAILQLSYLDAAERSTLFAQPEPRREPTEPRASEREEGAAEPAAPAAVEPERQRARRSRGDRVRVFGSVSVPRDEEIDGEVVAVFGSVRVDGVVRQQVVAVLGSVDLGPEAIVRGDVVSVGGRVRRAEGARIEGAVTEVSLNSPGMDVHVEPWMGGWGFGPFGTGTWGAVPRLIGSTFRLLLLALLASIALLLARGTVEGAAQRVSDEPVKATLVGVAAQILVIPVLVLTAIILAVSIIGIPALLLLPFAVLLLLLMALAGFAGSAFAAGAWVRRRFSLSTQPGYVDLWIGVVALLLPLLVGRVIALAGWGVGPLVFLLIAIGLCIEYVAWTSGFGAVLANAFGRWQARRASRATPPPVTTTTAAPQ